MAGEWILQEIIFIWRNMYDGILEYFEGDIPYFFYFM